MPKIFKEIYSSFHDLESKKSLHFELRTTDSVARPPCCICYLYLSMILLASSKLSSTEVVLPSTLGLSSLFKAMNAKYITPIVANAKKAVERNDLSRKSAKVTATMVTDILANGLGIESGTRLVPASIPSLPTLHTV